MARITVPSSTGSDNIDQSAALDDLFFSGGLGNDTFKGGTGADEIHGGDGNDKLSGGTGNDSLFGDGGNDELDGSGGDDVMHGGAGNDLYFVSEAGDLVDETTTGSGGTDGVITKIDGNPLNPLAGNVEVLLMHSSLGDGTSGYGNSGNNVLFGNANNNSLFGSGGNDMLFGDDPNMLLSNNDGDDVLDGGTGADTMAGGAGNDWYYVDNIGDVVSEAIILPQLNLPGSHASGFTLQPTLNPDMGGVDTVVFQGSGTFTSYTLGANLENLVLANGALYGFGNALNNVITGDFGGSNGSLSNILDGKGGADTMAGGLGNDTYVADNGGDEILEAADSGIDELQVKDMNYLLNPDFWNRISDPANLSSMSNIEIIRLFGNSSGASGNNLDNTIYASSAYIETALLVGGGGNDTYYLANDKNIVGEFDGDGDHDLIYRAFESARNLFDNVEDLTLQGSIAKTGKGNSKDNKITGNGIANDLQGMDGNDWLIGLAGNDTLDGGNNADLMDGGDGDDTYRVDQFFDVIFDSSGTDTIESTTGDFDMSTNAQTVEKFVIKSGSTEGAGITGNRLNNTITGNGGYSILDGGAAITPYLGADTLIGGGGQDVYVIHSVKDVIVETEINALDGDTVWLDTTSFTAPNIGISYTLGANLEHLQLLGNRAANVTGNAAGNTLIGNDQNNQLFGKLGNDNLSGGGGDDWLQGDEGNDTLTGGAGNDTLYGVAGNDLMDGGEGNDTYYVQDFNGDVATDSGTGGSDTVVLLTVPDPLGHSYGYDVTLTGMHANNLDSTVIYSGWTGIENLDLSQINYTPVTIDSKLNIYGDANNNIMRGTRIKDNFIGSAGDDTYYVTDGDTISGTDDGIDTIVISKNSNFKGLDITHWWGVGNNALNVENFILDPESTAGVSLGGNNLDNSLIGASGSDTMNGQGGSDTLIGMGGNDLYLIASAGVNEGQWVNFTNDHVDETRAGSGGNDTVQSAVSIDLADSAWQGIENVTLDSDSAAPNTSAWGNDGNNILVGNNQNNQLDGRGGIDTMKGGFGDDTYYADNAKDVMFEDINMGNDTIVISFASANPVFSAVTAVMGEIDPTTSISTAHSYVLPGWAENLILWENSSQTLAGIGNLNDNHIQGNNFNNYLFGAAGNDLLEGGQLLFDNGAGDDTLDGGQGTDTLRGGIGNDLYYVNMWTGVMDVVQEAEGDANGTQDHIITKYSYDLNMTAGYAKDATGIEILEAGSDAGSTTLNGYHTKGTRLVANGSGTFLFGGSGNDTYVLKSIKDVIALNVDNGGNDTVEEGFENYDLSDNDPNKPTAQNRYNPLDNITLLDINGVGGNWRAIGNDNGNILIGNSGANFIDGRGGADTMTGGKGNDTFIVDDAGDIVNEFDQGGSTDEVRSYISYDLRDSDNNHIIGTAGDYVENLSLFGSAVYGYGNGLNNVIKGNDGNNTLNGFGGNDTLSGGLGNDTLITAEGNDSLVGEGGDDYLNAGTGKDTMVGGAGNDYYYVDDIGDVVSETNTTENAAQAALLLGGDAVLSSISFTLSANLELLLLQGSNNINGTGNTLNNTISGNSGNNSLVGGGGSDSFIGSSGDDIYAMDTDDHLFGISLWIPATGSLNTDPGIDTIEIAGDINISGEFGSPNIHDRLEIENITLKGTGNFFAIGNLNDNLLVGNTGNNALTGAVGNDTLNGGTGIDTMNGGSGNDLYYVDNVNDVVVDADGGGEDTIVSFISYTLKEAPDTLNPNDPNQGNPEIEHLLLFNATTALNATGNSSNNHIQGNDLGNLLKGGDGVDTLDGMGGNDTLTGGLGTTGPVGDTAGDILRGGLGNDLYYVGTGGVKVVELAGTPQGIDTIISTIQFDLRDSDQDGILNGIGDNVENLTMTVGVNGHGNLLNNIIKANDEDNHLWGEQGNDTLDGGIGKDTLDGGTGADSLIGGAGDDVYIVDNLGDKIFEVANTAADTANNTSANHDTRKSTGDVVYTSVDFTLGTGLEHLFSNRSLTDLNSGAGIKLTGNTLNNHIVGDDGVNYLAGGGGEDTLEGGAGSDIYLYDAKAEIHEDAVDYLADPDNEDVLIVNQSLDLAQGAAFFADFVNFEGLALLSTGTGAFNLTGDTRNNVLVGNGGANILTGNDGDDMLAGMGGNDKLDGGAGNDSYFFYGTFGNDTIVDASGNDWVYFVNYDVTDPNFVNPQQFASALTIDLSTGANVISVTGGTITGMSHIQNIHGGAGNDKLTGNNNDNYLVGGKGNDSLTGLIGNDTLDGAEGVDTLSGGVGNDSYFIDKTTIGANSFWDIVVEAADGGHDTVYTSSSMMPTNPLYANIEDLVLLGSVFCGFGNELDNTITGNDAVNLIVGNGGNDLIYGLGGNDTLQGDDPLGAVGNDTLIGGLGNDALFGGGGNDTYVYNPGDGNDTVNDASGTDYLNLGAFSKTEFQFDGVDRNSDGKIDDLLMTLIADTTQKIRIVKYFDYLNLVDGAGSGFIETIHFNDGDITTTAGTGLSVNGGTSGNDTLTGGSGNDTLNGLAGNDILYGDLSASSTPGSFGDDSLIGGEGNDQLYGHYGNDTLNGGVGNDFLRGEQGNDTYQIDVGEGSDDILDNEGTDILVLGSGYTKNNILLARDFTSLDGILIGAMDSNGNLRTDSLITINGELDMGAGNASIEKIQLSDGSYISDADLSSLLQNMETTYMGNNPGDTNGMTLSDLATDSQAQAILGNSFHA